MPNGPILVVDDEPENLAALRQILSADYRLVYARDGTDALTAAVKHTPALILLDVRMPGMDGYTACRALKADPRTQAIPVIFVSGLADAGDEEAGFAAGAVDYIVKPVSAPIVRARVRTHLSLVRSVVLEQSWRDAIWMLSEAGHFNDTDTGAHIWRMAGYARRLAEAVGWAPDEAALLELAAPMHDMGKIGVPHPILKKPGKLDEAEWAVMRTRSRIGRDILARSDAPVFRLAAEIALHHHEKWDGSGYPDGLAGEAIPESARIVAVADVFDALTMKRPYKDAWPIDRVMATIADGSGTHFEPRLATIFATLLPDLLEIRKHWDDTERRDSEAEEAAERLARTG